MILHDSIGRDALLRVIVRMAIMSGVLAQAHTTLQLLDVDGGIEEVEALGGAGDSGVEPSVEVETH